MSFEMPNLNRNDEAPVAVSVNPEAVASNTSAEIPEILQGEKFWGWIKKKDMEYNRVIPVGKAVEDYISENHIICTPEEKAEMIKRLDKEYQGSQDFLNYQ